MRAWQFISLIVSVTSLIVLVFMLGFTPRQESLLKRYTLLNSPDYFFDKVQSIEFDIHGQPIESIQAAKLVHYENNTLTELTRPLIKRRDVNGNSWYAKGDNGLLENTPEDFQLKGNTEVVREGSLTQIRLTADQIHYHSKKQNITGTGRVTLRSRNSTLSSDLITVALDSEQTTMQGSVTGVYESP